MSKYEHCHHCRWELLFSCFLGNADTLIKSPNCVSIKSVRWWACLPASAPLALCSYLKCLPKERIKSNQPMGVIFGPESNGNQLRTLAEVIIWNDMLLAAHIQTVSSSTAVRQKLDLCLRVRPDVRADGPHFKACVGPVVETAQCTESNWF